MVGVGGAGRRCTRQSMHGGDERHHRPLGDNRGGLRVLVRADDSKDLLSSATRREIGQKPSTWKPMCHIVAWKGEKGKKCAVTIPRDKEGRYLRIYGLFCAHLLHPHKAHSPPRLPSLLSCGLAFCSGQLSCILVWDFVCGLGIKSGDRGRGSRHRLGHIFRGIPVRLVNR